jgi:hypothetical protein
MDSFLQNSTDRANRELHSLVFTKAKRKHGNLSQLHSELPKLKKQAKCVLVD